MREAFLFAGFDPTEGVGRDFGGAASHERPDVACSGVLEDVGVRPCRSGAGIGRGDIGVVSTNHDQHRMGSVLRQTSVAQGSSASRQYDAFGNVHSPSGTFVGPFGFAGNWGYQSDADSGLQLLGHRYYDPSTGRFLTRDPIKDGRNWYAYVENNPLRGVDPEGLQESEFTRNGREWHKVIQDYYRKKYPSHKINIEKRLENRMRPDIVNFTKRDVLEMKPDNPEAIRRGMQQIKLYAEELGFTRGVIIVYPPGTRPSQFKDPIMATKWYPAHKNVPPWK